MLLLANQMIVCGWTTLLKVASVDTSPHLLRSVYDGFSANAALALHLRACVMKAGQGSYSVKDEEEDLDHPFNSSAQWPSLAFRSPVRELTSPGGFSDPA